MPERFSNGWPSTLQSAPSASPEDSPHCKAKDTSTWSTCHLPAAATPDALACAPYPQPYSYGSSDGNDQRQSSPPPPVHSPSSRQCKGPKYPWPRPQCLAVAPPKTLDNSHPDSLADDHRQDTPPSPYPGPKPTGDTCATSHPTSHPHRIGD